MAASLDFVPALLVLVVFLVAFAFVSLVTGSLFNFLAAGSFDDFPDNDDRLVAEPLTSGAPNAGDSGFTSKRREFSCTLWRKLDHPFISSEATYNASATLSNKFPTFSKFCYSPSQG